jgi:hypothetical protein
MLERKFEAILWREVVWQRPFELEAVQEMLVHLASLTTRGPIVWEARSNGKRVRYLLGMEKAHQSKIKQTILPHGKIQLNRVEEKRVPIAHAVHLKLSKPTLTLKTDNATAVIRAALAAMHQCREHEELVLQIILGPALLPSPTPHNMPDPHASWLDTVLGNVGSASAESRAAVKDKISQHGFACAVRLGAVSGDSEAGAKARINGLYAALKVLESVGVRVTTKLEDAAKLNDTHVPWHFPLHLSVKELAHFLLLPIGDGELPGTPGLHPKLCLPPDWYCAPTNINNDRSFAVAMDGKTRLSISPKDSLEHTHIIGPTGSGKSTAMLNLILKDIQAGRGVLVIDPKADLVHDILARIPEHRDKDVVVLDPSDLTPVGFNPLAYKANPTLVADAILSVFKEVFKENWGILSQDVMSAALLTLAQVPGATLLWLPRMLTDDAFRLKITSQVSDRIGLDSYWAGFDAMKDGERRREIAPVLNKLRQFILRPGLRNVLGQSNPKFRLEDLFNKKRIVLVPLNKGVIGSESARLLGSLIVGQMWTLALSRAALPPEERHIVNVYIDELQDYLSLPTDLSDALAQARGLGVSLTLAHQYREQLPPEIRAGVDTNTRNKIVFGLNASDAKSMAAMAPELDAVDFMSLPRYQIYTSFQSGGKSTGWVQGQTMPPPQETRLAAELKAKSMAVYGKPVEEVEAECLAQLGYESPNAEPETEAPKAGSPTAGGPVGRRKKTDQEGPK